MYRTRLTAILPLLALCTGCFATTSGGEATKEPYASTAAARARANQIERTLTEPAAGFSESECGFYAAKRLRTRERGPAARYPGGYRQVPYAYAYDTDREVDCVRDQLY